MRFVVKETGQRVKDAYASWVFGDTKTVDDLHKVERYFDDLNIVGRQGVKRAVIVVVRRELDRIGLL